MSKPEKRYEVSILIGPCTEDQAVSFMKRVSDFVDGFRFPEDGSTYGAAVAMGPWNESPDA